MTDYKKAEEIAAYYKQAGGLSASAQRRDVATRETMKTFSLSRQDFDAELKTAAFLSILPRDARESLLKGLHA